MVGYQSIQDSRRPNALLFRAQSLFVRAAFTAMLVGALAKAGSRAPAKVASQKHDSNDRSHDHQHGLVVADDQPRVVNGEDVSQSAHLQYKWVTPIEVNVPNEGASSCGGKLAFVFNFKVVLFKFHFVWGSLL
jgi:hypothetical protein